MLDLNQTTDESRLTPCGDCGKPVSRRAESCPSCGRFFQSFRLSMVIGKNWSLRIALGIILAYVCIFFINVCLFFVFGAFIIGAFSNSSTGPKNTPTLNR